MWPIFTCVESFRNPTEIGDGAGAPNNVGLSILAFSPSGPSGSREAHGKFLGSPNLVAPEAIKSCGTFLMFMYFMIAELVGAPSGKKIKSTSSPSASLLACSTVFGGL